MKPYKSIIGLSGVVILSLLFSGHASAQVVVNEKNLNDDKDLQYIQLMYYIDKATLKPVYFLDFGFIEPEYNDILKPEQMSMLPRIMIDGRELTDRISAVGVLNRLHKAGWEYMGDVVYFPTRVMDNWYVFTLRRR